MRRPLIHSWFKACEATLARCGLAPLGEVLFPILTQRFDDYTHGLLDEWLALYEQLPTLTASRIELKEQVCVEGEALSEPEHQKLTTLLQGFHPWRKGPFFIHGVHIDTEWRSDWKWARIEKALSPLEGKSVLDIGCGSGYHLWRMLGAGAACAIGIDPSQLFLMQFEVIKHFLSNQPAHLLPIGIEYLPTTLKCFDTVFSMGVLYHRRDPFAHLAHLKALLKEHGELVLETLVVEGDARTVFVPKGRYQSMRNVWFLPSPQALEQWLARAGFKDIRLIDVSTTTPLEQRQTAWMRYHSLVDFLNPKNPSLTIEGHPAPQRALFIAKA